MYSAAWYVCVASIIQRYPETFGSQHGEKLLKLSLGSKETEAKVSAALWECLLAFMHHVQVGAGSWGSSSTELWQTGQMLVGPTSK